MKPTFAIAHRVCPALSKTAIGYTSKADLVRDTTESLAATLSNYGHPARLHVILDGCNREYKDIFNDQFRDVQNVEMAIIETPAIGNAATFGKQITILLGEDEASLLYFSEDDYLYKPFAFKAMAEVMGENGVDFVTPLDHPDRYADVTFEDEKSLIRHTSLCHWRQVPSSCLTFMTTPGMLRQTRWIFDAYARGHMDSSMWLAATKQRLFSPSAILGTGLQFLFTRNVPYPRLAQLCAWKWYGLKLLATRKYNLWSPIPSLAFHLSKDCIPPCDGGVEGWFRT